jgi:hypothetical protein
VIPTLTLLGKPDCHLCHEMADVVRRVVGERVALVEADVRSREEWKKYVLQIPVLLLGENEVVRHRVTEDGLREKLRERGLPV